MAVPVSEYVLLDLHRDVEILNYVKIRFHIKIHTSTSLEKKKKNNQKDKTRSTWQEPTDAE